MIRFMDEYYEIRRNIVKELIEFRRKPTTTDEKASSDFAILRAKDVNTFYINAQMKGISCSQNSLKALVDSDYAKPFNPFTHYFFSLPTWNGKTDYIAQLAQRVKNHRPGFLHDTASATGWWEWWPAPSTIKCRTSSCCCSTADREAEKAPLSGNFSHRNWTPTTVAA